MSDEAHPNETPASEPTPDEPTEGAAASAESTAPSDRPSESRATRNGPAPSRGSSDRPRVMARYGLMGLLGEFTYSKKIAIEPGCKLVLQTERGIEIGEHVPVSGTDPSGGPTDLETVRKFLQQSGPDYLQRRGGRVLRVASEQDLAEERHIDAGAAEELAYCQQLVRQHDLPMKLIVCEHLFGGERIIFYFLADGRVDFRQLVRDLAKQYQTRIEMRQVGARDEARLVADYDICGRQCCCKNFLKTLRPVSMKMAKMQKATLDPSKVSGRCGRLRCCLRYEHEVYEELNRRLARNNTWVRTADGDGKVVDRQVITQLVTVELEGQRRVTFPFEEVEVLADRPPQREAAAAAAPQTRAKEPGKAPTSEADEAGEQPRRRRRRRKQDVGATDSQATDNGASQPTTREDEQTGRDVAAPAAGDSTSETPKDQSAPGDTAEQKPPSGGEGTAASSSGRKRGSRRRRRRRRPSKGGGGGHSSKGR